METNTSNKSVLEQAVRVKLGQWKKEALIAASRALRDGKQASVFTYPTGLKMMRFAEPFTDYGMHYEVEVEAWNLLVKNKGIIC